MTKKTKVKFMCDACEGTFTETVDCFGELSWMCPKCKSKEKVYLTDVKEPKTNDEPIVLGRGGCLHS